MKPISRIQKRIVLLLVIAAVAAIGVAASPGLPVFADSAGDIGNNEELYVMITCPTGSAYQSPAVGVELLINTPTDIKKLEYIYSTDEEDTKYTVDVADHEVVEGRNGRDRWQFSVKIGYFEGDGETPDHPTHNGEMVAIAYVDNGEDALLPLESDIYQVRQIDYAPPVLQYGADETLWYFEAGVLKLKVKATDHRTLPMFSATSGLRGVWVFYAENDGIEIGDGEQAGEDFDPDDILIDNFVLIHEKRFDTASGGQQTNEYATEITVDKNGTYYVMMTDMVNNLGLTRLFRYDDAPQYKIDVNGTTVNLDAVLDQAADQIERGKDYYHPSVIESLQQARDDVLYAFMTGQSDEKKKEAYLALVHAQNFYNNATVTFTLKINNEEFLDGAMKLYGFDMTIASDLLNGETLMATVDVLRYAERDKFDEEAIRTADFPSVDLMFRLRYRLTRNDLAFEPEGPFRLRMEVPDTYRAVRIVRVDPESGAYTAVDCDFGGAWLEFEIADGKSDYFVLVSRDEQGGNLALWIGLGVGGGVLIAAIVVLIILKKKGILDRKSAKRKGQKASEQGAELADSDARLSTGEGGAEKPKPANKSKKKKKK